MHLPRGDNRTAAAALRQTAADSRTLNRIGAPLPALRPPASSSSAASPEHQIHQLKPLPLEEALPIGWQHEARAQGVKEVLHHLLLLGRGWVVTFEHLWRWGGGEEGTGSRGSRGGKSETESERKSRASHRELLQQHVNALHLAQ